MENSVKNTKKNGLAKAVKKLGFEFIGDHHRGIDDAINAAEVFRRIGIDEKKMSEVWN